MEVFTLKNGFRFSFEGEGSIHQVGSYNRYRVVGTGSGGWVAEKTKIAQVTYSPVSVRRGEEYVRYEVEGPKCLEGKSFPDVQSAWDASQIASDSIEDPKEREEMEAAIEKLTA